MYPTLQAFYDADREGRLRSEEADYGVMWRLDGWEGQWRVAYVRNTGEIYATQDRVASGAGPVFVLGRIPADDVAEGVRGVFYSSLDALLEGWPKLCGQPDGLRWLHDRIRAAVTLQLQE